MKTHGHRPYLPLHSIGKRSRLFPSEQGNNADMEECPVNEPTNALGNYLLLMYFNRYLFERGIITRQEYLSMNEHICQRYPSAARRAN